MANALQEIWKPRLLSFDGLDSLLVGSCARDRRLTECEGVCSPRPLDPSRTSGGGKKHAPTRAEFFPGWHFRHIGQRHSGATSFAVHFSCQGKARPFTRRPALGFPAVRSLFSCYSLVSRIIVCEIGCGLRFVRVHPCQFFPPPSSHFLSMASNETSVSAEIALAARHL